MNAWSIPCLRGIIGDRVYYSALMDAKQVSKRISPSKDLHEAKTLDDFLQRELRDRVKKIAGYLLSRDNRFFNSIIVGVFDALPQWIAFDMHKAATDLDLPDDIGDEDSLGILVFTGSEKMFAIDGQHRVSGIGIAEERDPEKMSKDQFSVILVAHIDDKPGRVVTRRLFSDINKRAVPVSNGDKVIIDEDELNAIAARRVFEHYAPFKGIILITEQEKMPEANLTHFTNLLTLYRVNKILRKLFKKQRGLPEYDVKNVKAFYEQVTTFYDFLIKNVPSYKRFFILKKSSLLTLRKDNLNLLFRPVGLVILAKLYVIFALREKLEVLKRGIALAKWESPGGVFDSVLWNDGKIEARAENVTAAVHLCAYLFGQDIETKAQLRKRLAKITKSIKYKLPARLV